MVCKITSIKQCKKRWRAGVTLVEVLVTTAIAAVVLAGLASLIFYTGRSFAALANYVDLDAKSRHALDLMSREIRQSRKVLAGSGTSLEIEDAEGKKVLYAYDSSARTLTRAIDGVADADPLLTECNFLEFAMFQRNPVSGKYDQHPAAAASTCKLVQLKWVCSRDLIKSKWNTESVQSAKIVIRKQ
jgi:prepilin-type N-terminal cleavage/methylation domain-containing protein